MARKQMAWKTKGMQRDLSVSAFNPEFAFENRNLRLSTNDGNTDLSWVNERGPQKLSLYINTEPWKTDGTILKEKEEIFAVTDSLGNLVKETNPDTGIETQVYETVKVSPIEGIPIGTAILNNKLVVFTTLNTKEESYSAVYSGDNQVYDCIYVFESSGGFIMNGKMLYKGNLNFSALHPLETLVSYEAEHIQKVYWTDNRNQPRLINIADVEHLKKWNHVDSNDNAVYPIEPDTFFDFVPTIEMNDTTLSVQRNFGGGLFAPGVIQYCFAYINKYGQESNIVAVSPLYYLSFEDRGASPEEKVTCSFDVKIEHLDTNFDAVRIYSVQRTSLNLEPIVRQFKDLKIENSIEVHYTDIGTDGVSMDPTELLYVGGKEVTVLTMTDKDQTLFLGNFTQKDASMTELQNYFNSIRGAVNVTFEHNSSIKSYTVSSSDAIYSYENQLGKSQEEISTFKGGEWYRFGFQLQKKTGEWTEPIFLKDVQNKLYPATSGQLPYAVCELASSHFDREKFKRIRPLVVYPNIVQRSVVCQGVLNPTVVNVADAKTGSPDAQASWYFRPYILPSGEESLPPAGRLIRNLCTLGSYVAFEHNDILPCSGTNDLQEEKQYNKRVEIQGAADESLISTVQNGDDKSNACFKVNQRIVTLNSPDIEFDTDVQNIPTTGLNLRIVGTIPITSSASAHSILTSSPMLEVAHGVPLKGSNSEYALYEISQPFGSGELSVNTYYKNSRRAGNRLVADYLWNDAIVRKNKDSEADDGIQTYPVLADYMIYPWHKSGSLNNDPRPIGEASSVLKTKKESNIFFSKDSIYNFPSSKFDYAFDNQIISNIYTQLHLTENDYIYNIRLKDNTGKALNYYPNIDKALFNSTDQRYLLNVHDVEWNNPNYAEGTAAKLLSIVEGNEPWDLTESSPILSISNIAVLMKYKSTSHAVLHLGNNILSDVNINNTSDKHTRRILEPNNNYLLLGELYRDRRESPFTDAIYQQWNVGGKTIDLDNNPNSSIVLKWTIGDTYYQRYDCLKTYAFTNDDPNQIIEILSFMCETHVNIDGRYDRNRGQIDNTNMRPQIFNLFNPVYSQQDNFFNYQKLGIDKEDKNVYPNQITYSKTKTSGADVDMWTNTTLASVLELDGDKGSLNKLTRLNDQIIAFQDTGISQILYNENAAISTQQGVPIELANSGKVQGKRYLSDTIGCSNKWSIVNSPSGIYFMDSIGKNIFVFNGELTNLSTKAGFNTWCKQNIPQATVKWNPYRFANTVSYYDKKNQEVIFINQDKALAFSEKLGAFTSFYDYGNAPYFCNLDDAGLWLSKENYSDTTQKHGGYSIWKHHEGWYCRFFNKNKPYWMTLISNAEPLTDKIFTNLEFRACVDGEGEEVAVVQQQTGQTTGKKKYEPFLPFDYLETWNEYQHGVAHIGNRNGHDLFKHHSRDGLATLKRKFRIWRCDIPRDNSLKARTGIFDYTFDNTFRGGEKLLHPLDRMRNPWLYVNLMKETVPEYKTIKVDEDGEEVEKTVENSLPKAEIHDLVMTYFN